MKLLFFLLLSLLAQSFHGANALSCQEQWQCGSVAVGWGSAECVDGQCVCVERQGFSGSATTTDKCDCYDGEIIWRDVPYCVNWTEHFRLKHEDQVSQSLEHTVKELYNLLLWPTPQYIIFDFMENSTSILDGIFAPHASGQVAPVGSYGDRNEFIEYYFGTVWTEESHIVGVEFMSISSDPVNYRVGVHVKLTAQFSGEGYVFQVPLIQVGTYKLDENFHIVGGDLVLPRLGEISDPTNPTGQDLRNLVWGLYQMAGCGEQFDAEGYYEDVNDFMTFTSTVDDGTWSHVDDNSMICRQYHGLMALVRPDVHCMHMGKTGGGKCTYHSYFEYVGTNYIE